MKLKIALVDSLMIPGTGKAWALCDESGEMLPMQTDVSISQGIDRLTQVTVTFVIDGDLVSIAS